MADKAVAVIAGVGEGLGLALSRRFGAAGYRVAMLARNRERLTAFEQTLTDAGVSAVGVPLDVRDDAAIVATLERIEAEQGPIEVAIYNAGAQYRKPALEISADTFEKVWRLGCLGGFVFGREAIRHMQPRGKGSVLFTGATSSLRGGANFAAFAAAKFGLRAVAQSLAREFGPQGIHVASVFVDGAIDMPAIHRMFPDRAKTTPPNGLLSPDAIAETYLQLHLQHPSAWTQEADIRPYCEKF